MKRRPRWPVPRLRSALSLDDTNPPPEGKQRDVVVAAVRARLAPGALVVLQIEHEDGCPGPAGRACRCQPAYRVGGSDLLTRGAAVLGGCE